jgi:hypothetical protein
MSRIPRRVSGGVFSFLGLIAEASGQKSQEEMAVILAIPLWQRGMKGDFKNRYFLMTNS